MSEHDTIYKYATQIVLPIKIIQEGHKKAMQQSVVRMFAGAFIQKMIIDRRKAISLQFDEDSSDRSLHGGLDLNAFVEAIDDSSLLSLVAQMEHRQANLENAVLAVNDIPWWRLLWAKIRRRELVEVAWQ